MDSDFFKYQRRKMYTEVVKNEYVQQHCEYGKNYQIKRFFTPTHIKTYPNGDPSYIMDIQAINFTKSRVLFFKDYENNCCIDIYDEEQNNPYKCRIIGINGSTYYENGSSHLSGYSVYETLSDVGSFVDKKKYIIYIDYYGLYIVSARENSIHGIVERYNFSERTFNGSVIKISAFDGKRTLNNQPIVSENFTTSNSVENNAKAFFGLNCSKDTPVFFANTFAPITKYYPLMNQIEGLTGLKLKTLAPSEKSAKKRIATVLNVNEDQIFIKDGMAYFIDAREKILNDACDNKLSRFLDCYYTEYKRHIPLISDVPNELIKTVKSHIISIYQNKEKYEYFISPYSTIIINKCCALDPWDNI